MKKIILYVAVVSLAFAFYGCSNKSNGDAEASTAQSALQTTQSADLTADKQKHSLTPTEEDGNTLYSYSYIDSKNIGDGNSETISVQNVKDGKKYTLKEHVLSCGTHMNGWILETTGKGKTVIEADFKVTHNSYKIKDLEVRITELKDSG
ncbi:MAG TPA: hypothetical protein VHT34_02495, partial [Clostridia bacterium]|nr:hypothetical protein [Clostridia bacterium]